MSLDEWRSLLPYLDTFAEAIGWAIVVTLGVTLGAAILALALGAFFAVLKMLGGRWGRFLASAYVEVFRAVPTLTLLFLIYFGLPQAGLRLDPITSSILAFGLHGGAYLTEALRAGFESVHRGQMEAGLSLGMTRLESLRYVLTPQALRVFLPPFCNYVLLLMKDTSLASVIAVPELMFQARLLVDQTYLTTQIYLLVALVYLAMSLPLSWSIRRLERHLDRGYARQGS